MNRTTIQRKLTRSTIYSGRLLTVGWFASQGCFPIYHTPVPIPSPCPTNAQGQEACPSAPPKTAAP